MKPRTYVNRSGSAISYLLRRFAVNSERLLVILDDMNLDPGLIRIRREGSDGGHNGLKSVLNVLLEYELESDDHKAVAVTLNMS